MYVHKYSPVTLSKLTMRLVDGMELLIIITAVFVQAMLGQARAINVINALIVWRFIVRIPADSEFIVVLFFRSDGSWHWRGLSNKCSHRV